MNLIKYQSLTQFGTLYKSKLTFPKFKEIMSFPIWNYSQIAIIKTRAYENGLDGVIALLNLNETFRERMTISRFELNKIRIFYFVLDLLDRLDRVEDFLAVWGQIQQESKIFKHSLFPKWYGEMDSRPSFTHPGRKFQQSKQFLESYYAQMHYLYLTYRKEIIEKKLATKRSGRKFIRHRPQNGLDEAEINDRLNWISSVAEEARRSKERRVIKYWPYILWFLFSSVKIHFSELFC